MTLDQLNERDEKRAQTENPQTNGMPVKPSTTDAWPMAYRNRLLDLATKVAKSQVKDASHSVDRQYNALLGKVLAMIESGIEDGYTRR